MQSYYQRLGTKYNHMCVVHVVMLASFVERLMEKKVSHHQCGIIDSKQIEELSVYDAADLHVQPKHARRVLCVEIHRAEDANATML